MEKIKNKVEKIQKMDLIIAIIIVAIAVMYISVIFNDSLWADEAYTMQMLSKSFLEIVSETAEDVHPPLYYFIAKIFTMIFGYSIVSVKLASILPVILVMLFVRVKSKKLFGDNANLISILFILLIGLCPRAFSMAVELRMYTWAMFFVTCSGIYAYELYKEPKNKKVLCLFVLFSLAAAYTHYYALLTECIIYLFLMISLLHANKSNLETCLVIVVTTIIGYLPWVPVVIRQFMSNVGSWWLDELSGDMLLDLFTYLFEGKFAVLFLSLIALAIIGLILYIKKQKDDEEAWFALFSIMSFVIMILIGVIVSELIRPVFFDRYMYTAVGLLFLGVSIAVCKHEYRNGLKYLFIGLILVNLPFSYHELYENEYRTGTDEFIAFVENNIKDEPIATNIVHFRWTVLPYYFPNNEVTRINKNTRGYVMTPSSQEDVEDAFVGANVSLVFQGNVDNKYYFNVYYVE